MARLTKTHKAFIVRRLARYASVREVISEFRESFDDSVSKQQVALYNPENKSSTLGREMRELFYRERNTFLDDTSDLILTRRGVRIRKLCETADEAEKMIKLAENCRDKCAAIRTFTDILMKIHKIVEPDHKTGVEQQDEDYIPPTLQKINSYIYFDK